MVRSVFAFGQRGGFLLECDSMRRSGSLPPALKQQFDEDKVKETYCLALGAGKSFVATYRGKDGLQHLSCDNIPLSLRDWLYETNDSGVLVRELDQLQVTLGPYNNSFYAFDGKRYIGAGLPKYLTEALQSRKGPDGNFRADKAPRLVCLGFGENYAMIDESHGGSWVLGHYPAAKACLDAFKTDEAAFRPIVNLTLNAYRINHYVLHGESGLVLYDQGPPLIQLHVEAIAKDILQDRKREQELEALLSQRQGLLQAQERLLLERQLQEQQQLMRMLKYQQRANVAASMGSMVAALAGLNMIVNSSF